MITTVQDNAAETPRNINIVFGEKTAKKRNMRCGLTLP